jgi:hypothetical protein
MKGWRAPVILCLISSYLESNSMLDPKLHSATMSICPNGHRVEVGASNENRTECDLCGLVATQVSADGVTWMHSDDYDEQCRELQDAMDSAFDDQYFGGGW